jgi:hypothetical protein
VRRHALRLAPMSRPRARSSSPRPSCIRSAGPRTSNYASKVSV